MRPVVSLAVRPALAVALLLCVAGWSLSAMGQSPGQPEGTLPLVIPHPQKIQTISREHLVLGENGTNRTETVLRTKGDFFDEASKLIDDTLRRNGLAKRSQPPATSIVILTRPAMVSGPRQQDLPTLTEQQSAVLARSDQAYLILMRPRAPSRVWIVGASPLGAWYGATTLVQLMTAPGAGRVVLPHVEIEDYPDMPGRMCADWVLTWDWEINGYDWGDGLAAFVDRCKRKIDLCGRYKVNRVRFLGGRISPGPDYMKDRYDKIRRFALELNRYARRRGVALQFSSSSWGVDYYGWGLPWAQPWVLNRESYPDGPVYACAGGTGGVCLSNEALIDLVAKRQRQLVEDVEPGSIYLHHIDAATYAELVSLWKGRCARCRQRFPDDQPHSAQGYAAAVAGLYNRLTAQLKAVRNSASGYDASRDLEIVFASPGYSYWIETDAQWENELKYFSEIGRQLKDKRNIQITFREQFARLDGRGLRIEEMARALDRVGWPNAPFVFAVQGADFLDSARMFVSSPVLTAAWRGAGTLYSFNGHAHSEVQVLANVHYAWNHRAPGSVEPAGFPGIALRQEASRYSTGQRHSEFLYGRFLEAACIALYGEKAAPSMAALFRLERDKGPILALVAGIDYQWKNAAYDWRAQAGRNQDARQLALRAAALCDTDAKADLEWLSRSLEVSARICTLCDAVYREKLPKAEIEARAQALLKWLDANFQFQASEPDGGDPGLWKPLIHRIAKAPSSR
jgi:hypothetical protein